jgi:pantoate--beta-alanine ligase
MKIIRTIKSMQRVVRELTAKKKRLSLVPTMGYLHDGHLSLIKRAKRNSDVVIVSIFVNPTQFAPNEDLKKYPRDMKGDLLKIKKAGGDIVFTPDAKEIYPEDFQTYVTVENLTKTLEGKSRPGHFRGVTTIVSKLFNICRPDVVVFGMKDYQQAIVLKQMTNDLGYPVKFIIAPTVRERDGLAMSSRNSYFTPEQRQEAICLYYALQTAKNMVKAGKRKTDVIEREMIAVIKAACPSAKIEYIAFTDFVTLSSVKMIKKNTICSLVVKVQQVRLIDNTKLA